MSTLWLCVQVFFARIADVSLGTFRMMVSVKGKRLITCAIAFVEVFIWYVVARQVLAASEFNVLVAISYSAGYATGTFLGLLISDRFIKGTVGVQVVTTKSKMIGKVRHEGFAVSVIDLKNDFGKTKKELLFIQVNNRSLKRLLNIIKHIDSEAFIVVNETKAVQNGYIK